jgi:hypothetical protein
MLTWCFCPVKELSKTEMEMEMETETEMEMEMEITPEVMEPGITDAERTASKALTKTE